MSVTAIRTKLLTKLNEMRTLKAAYDWETSNPSGNYPFATLTIRGSEGEFASTAHNKRIRGFRVRIYQERSKIGQGPETAEDIIADVVDEIEVALDSDTTLSGTCKYVTPINWDALYIDRETDTRILEINVDAIELMESK